MGVHTRAKKLQEYIDRRIETKLQISFQNNPLCQLCHNRDNQCPTNVRLIDKRLVGHDSIDTSIVDVIKLYLEEIWKF